jgi:predicted nucleic acid-binding protein
VLQAREVAGRGLRASDALHIACAIAAGCDFFLTTDDVIVKRMQGFAHLTVMNPTQFIVEVK